MAELADLVDSIFDGTNRALYREFEGWVRDSRRFRAFASSYRTKIRAKLKNARGEEGVEDLRAELQTAVLLLGEERFGRYLAIMLECGIARLAALEPGTH